ncbi:hypothetical protein ACFPM0_02805 [Pseudonocardia sulfidoxydans]|uniref:hypothetical protein n=1 Tax=Pseudonocardia sulfidoxydans TaxID=54011 RepID=UPI0036120BE7
MPVLSPYPGGARRHPAGLNVERRGTRTVPVAAAGSPGAPRARPASPVRPRAPETP